MRVARGVVFLSKFSFRIIAFLAFHGFIYFLFLKFSVTFRVLLFSFVFFFLFS